MTGPADLLDAYEGEPGDGWGDDGGSGDGAGAVRAPRSWQPRPWWVWLLVLLALAVVALLAAGAQLAGAQLGTSLRVRSCDTSALGGVALLLGGGLCAALAFQVAGLHHHDAVLGFDVGAPLVTAPVPAALLAVALPGMLGCTAASSIARLDLVGDALVGTSGIVLAAAAAVLTGAALAQVVHVRRLPPAPVAAPPPPSLVDLAIQESEALRADSAATRFHGVDSD